MNKEKLIAIKLIKGFFMPGLLIVLLSFSLVPMADAEYSEGVIINLAKYQTITAKYINISGSLPQQLKVKIDGSEQAIASGTNKAGPISWTYTAQDNIDLKFYVEITPPNGVPYNSKVIQPENDGMPFPQFAHFSIGFQEKPGLPSCSLSAQFFVTPVINAYYKPDESIIYQNKNANYPEVALITIAAATKDGRYFYYWYADRIRLRIKLKPGKYGGARVKLVNLTTAIRPTTNSLLPDFWHSKCPDGSTAAPGRQFCHWHGLYWILGYYRVGFLKMALDNSQIGNGYDTPDTSKELPQIEFDITDYTTNPTVIAVVSWNYEKTISNLDFDLEYVTGPTKPELIPKGGLIKLNVDNAGLVREKLPTVNDCENIKNSLQSKGACYTEDPGPFVIYETDSPGPQDPPINNLEYRNIEYLLVTLQKHNLPMPQGDGCLDWIQVAAADIYSYRYTRQCPTEVANCVWRILTINKGLGAGWGYKAYFNPYDKEMRFNLAVYISYDFFYNSARDSVIFHEALHCYQSLRGAYVYDSDEDYLYFDYYNNVENRYFIFSHDTKKRGFLNLGYGKNPVEKFNNGYYGNSHHNNHHKGIFLTDITDELDREELKSIFNSGKSIGDKKILTEIPKDLPLPIFEQYNFVIKDICLYNPTNPTKEYIPMLFANLFIDSIIPEAEPVVHETYGYYTPVKFSFVIQSPYPENSLGKSYYTYITKKGYRLYVLYEMNYPPAPSAPYEYDASYFGISHRPRR